MTVKLLVQPDDSIEPVLRAVREARHSIDMYIFRLKYSQLEDALGDAVKRGVVVRTLMAHTSTGGDEALRELELRLLAIGAAVSRTDDDLLRYHGKMMIVDATTLFVLGYNFTRKDIDRSRSLGVAIDDDAGLVTEAKRLFDSDFDRKPYIPELDRLVVSPLNSRSRLMSLINGATEQLLIYDARLSDTMMQRAIEKRVLAGVEVRLIGQTEKKLKGVRCESYPGNRLHVRAMVRDGVEAFVGSQSLRRTELDRRREIGVIITDPSAIGQIVRTFEADWAQTYVAAD